MIKKENRSRLIIGSLIIFFGISIFISKYMYQYFLNKEDEEKIEQFFIKEEVKDQEIVEEIETTEEEIIIKNNYNYENYIAVLEIPKINLKRGIYDKSSNLNNVNKNITILKDSIMPSGDNASHIFLASHSGYGYTAFLKNINKLNVDDSIFFYYQNIKYIYKVSSIYEIEKTGSMSVSFTDGSDLTLITCIYGTNKQLVYVASLINQENY